MKKTLVTLLALSGIAMAGTEQQEILTLPATGATLIKGGQINNNRPFEGISNYTVTKVESIITQIGDVEGGNVYWGTGQGGNQTAEVSSTQSATIQGGIDLSFVSRPKLAGEWVMISVVAPENTTALTLNFTPDQKVGCAIFNYNATDSTLSLLNDAAIYSASQKATVTAGGLTLGANDIIMLAFGSQVDGGAGGGTTIHLQGMQLTATVTAPVPEPTTGSLSLLALAGLCIRRRK